MGKLNFKYHHKYFNEDMNTFGSIRDENGKRKIGFPLPMVNIRSNANSDAEGRIIGIEYNINLEGHIFAVATGLCGTELMKASVILEQYFKDKEKQGGVFQIGEISKGTSQDEEGKQGIIISGVVFKDFSLDRNENNWTRTIPYSVSLQGFHPGSGHYDGYYLQNVEDSWSIEQLDTISYFDYDVNTEYKQFKPGIRNPKLNEPPSENDLQKTKSIFNIESILQYRVTHRLSATGRALNTKKPENPGALDNINYAYYEAARWVQHRLGVATTPKPVPTHTQPTGIIIDSNNQNTQSPTSPIHNFSIYNHVRSVDANVGAGSYGVTDTWLALSSGIPYIEQSTWEVVTDDKFVQTVNLNGSVQGLEGAKSSGYTSLIVPFTGVVPISYIDNQKTINKNQSKLETAISGYINHVKPHLYRRASMVLSAISGSVNKSKSNMSTVDSFIGASGSPLNVTPTNYTESLNVNAGTLNYNVTYTNKPGSFLSGVLSSTMSVVDTGGVDQVAETFVLGRPLGPILQKVGATKTERRVNVEVVYPTPRDYTECHPNSPKCPVHKDNAKYKELKLFVDSFKPIAPEAFATIVPTSSYGVANQGQVFKTSETKSWNPFEGRYAWDVTWVYNTGVCN